MQCWAGGFSPCSLPLPCRALLSSHGGCAHLPADPPTVTLSIQPQTVQEGERVVFTCMATANPEIKGYR